MKSQNDIEALAIEWIRYQYQTIAHSDEAIQQALSDAFVQGYQLGREEGLKPEKGKDETDE